MLTVMDSFYPSNMLANLLLCTPFYFHMTYLLKRTYIKVGVAAVDLGDRRAVVTSVDVQATSIRVVPVVTTTSEYV